MDNRVKCNRINRTLDALLSTNVKREILNGVLEVTQTYFDALCDAKKATRERTGIWADQKYVLEKLLTACEMAFCGCVLDNESDINTAKWFVRHVMGRVSYYVGNKKLHESCRLKPQNSMKYAKALKNVVRREKIDQIIFVVPGGLLSAAALMYYTKKPLMGIRYSRLSRGDKKVYLPQNMYVAEFKKLVKDKKVLIIDDVLESGKTVITAANFVAAFRPKQVYLSVEGSIYRKDLQPELKCEALELNIDRDYKSYGDPILLRCHKRTKY